MEEYRDLDLTVEAFCRVLDEPAFARLPAGLVLQAYLPDTHAVLDQLVKWAAARRQQGGGYVKIRLVKGANLTMEHVDAELGGWLPAPYDTKAEVDASYKSLLWRASMRRRAVTSSSGSAATTSSTLRWPSRSASAASSPTSSASRCWKAWRRRRHAPCSLDADGVLLYTPVVSEDGLRLEHRLPVAPPRRERRTGELPAIAVHDRGRLTAVGARARAFRAGRRAGSGRSDEPAPCPGQAYRGASVRRRCTVHQRAGHRLHAYRATGNGSRRT